MAHCSLIEKCIFFNDKMADMPAMADIYKQRYCQGDSSLCARLMVADALGRSNVPSDLYPNDSARASQLANG